ncbi:hypothetical protein MRX96_008262 [Rhipicephalus microplus]
MRSQGHRGRESGSRPRNQVARARVAAEPKVGPSRKKPAAAGREDDDAQINLLGPLPSAKQQRVQQERLTGTAGQSIATLARVHPSCHWEESRPGLRMPRYGLR